MRAGVFVDGTLLKSPFAPITHGVECYADHFGAARQQVVKYVNRMPVQMFVQFQNEFRVADANPFARKLVAAAQRALGPDLNASGCVFDYRAADGTHGGFIFLVVFALV